jgi:lipoprotein Spr
MKKSNLFAWICGIFFLLGVLGAGYRAHAERSEPIRIADQDSLPTQTASASIKETTSSPSALVLKYAQKLGVDPLTVDQPAVWGFIDEWMGVRYVWGGNSKNGIDCSAFTERILNEVYQVKSSRLVMGQYNLCTLIDSSDLKLGDLIFFKTHNKRKGLTHVAFSLGGRYFIHASSSRGVVIDRLDNSYYRKTYRSSGRLLSEKGEEIDPAKTVVPKEPT